MSAQPLNDKQRDLMLVKRAQKGDTEAFQRLVENYEARLYRLVFQVVRNEEDARDVIQDVLVKIYLSLKDFRGQSSFFTWAYRVAFNLAVDWKRKYGKIAAKTDSQSSEAVESLVEQIPSQETPADDLIDQQQQRAAVNGALSQMSPEQRSIVVLRDVDGLSYEEISGITGLPKGTVMSRLFYGRKKLMQLLSKFRMKSSLDSSNTRIAGDLDMENHTFQATGVNDQNSRHEALSLKVGISSGDKAIESPEKSVQTRKPRPAIPARGARILKDAASSS